MKYTWNKYVDDILSSVHVPLSNYSLTHSVQCQKDFLQYNLENSENAYFGKTSRQMTMQLLYS